ncbi:MAG: hydroxypyruvate isomerase [Gammaproteobacteria bacterium]|jgi:hydroxypyruvate isomerase|nr:hydroxypyruvate isomerase [Gammaproteobacteria bacterium]
MSDESPRICRRTTLKALVTAAGVFAANGIQAASAPPSVPTGRSSASSSRLKQAVCRWPYTHVPLPEFCRRAKHIGLAAIDLLFADEWPVASDAGLAVSMGYASRREKFIQTGFNDPVNHALLLEELEMALPLAARAHVANLIAMFGNRVPGIDDATAIANCVAGLSKIAPVAEKQGVTICVELLNSKVDHPGYQGDHSAFGVAVVQGVNSPRVKLLYDIYHMQIMEGDVIRTIRDNITSIGHFHTGGVPGRHEINDSQELNYHAIAAALADLNFQGYLAHEFKPTRSDPFVSLTEAFQLCTV